MRVSKKRINPRISKQIFEIFYQVIADIKNPQEAEIILKGILTKSELEALSKRLAVAHYLKKGRTYENIKNSLGISSATIATIQEQMNKKNGLALALKKIQAEEWADKWAKRIGKIVKKEE